MNKITNYIISSTIAMWIGMNNAHSQTTNIKASDNCKMATINAKNKSYTLPEVTVCNTANEVRIIILWNEYTWDTSLLECINNELKKYKNSNDELGVSHKQDESIEKVTLAIKDAAEVSCKK